MRKGFREGIKPVSVTGGAVCFRRGRLFVTDIPRGKYFSRRISDAKSDFPRELYVYPSRKVAFRDGYPYNSRGKSLFASDICREKPLSARDIRREKSPSPKTYRTTSYGDEFYTLVKTFSHEFLTLSKTLFYSSDRIRSSTNLRLIV